MEEAHKTERRLAAILSADVAGYSRMMAEDEAATVLAVKRCREIIDAHVREHHGRIVDAPGDNVLSEFPSAVEAVQCAVEVQRELTERNRALEPARRMEFRIGIHVGDVILDDGKIYGDGVNIAARLEALATPGGICISREVHDQIRGKLDIDCEDIGEQQVKNNPRPVRVLRVRMGATPMAPATLAPSRRRVVIGTVATLCVLIAISAAYFIIARNRRPTSSARPAAEPSTATLAVLPFANLSASKDDEYFSDGITDEISGDLSKIAGLQVTARSSAFAFKGQNEDVKKIARLLNVRNILEGSVRRSADRIRVEVELIDALNGFTVWSDRYDEKMTDVFQIQSDVAESVAGNLKVKLLADERARIEKRPTQSREAYDLYLLGNHYNAEQTEGSTIAAIDCFKRAIAKDPNFSLAYAFLAENYENLVSGMAPRDVIPKAREAAEKALLIDDSNAVAHSDLAWALWAFDWDWSGAEHEFRHAIALDPNQYLAHLEYGQFLRSMGRYEESLKESERARELNPLFVLPVCYIGDTFYMWRHYDQALVYYAQAIEMGPNYASAYGSRVSALVTNGDLAGAVRDAEKAQALDNEPRNVAAVGWVYGLAGRRADAEKILDQLQEMSKRRYVSPFAFVSVYGGLGDERGWEWFEKSYQERSIELLYLKSPAFDRLRSDPRFQAIYKKVGLPD